MKIIEGMIQGSREWHAFRQLHIGSSESAIVAGFNPWRSKLSLWQEKVLGWEEELDQISLDRMIEGQRMEPVARDAYQSLTHLLVEPMVIESTEWPFLSASMDGMTKSLDYAVEIKCGASSHKWAKKGSIPLYYICQIQHQMLVTGLKSIDYFSYFKGECILLTVNRDDELIQELLEKEKDFWHNVQTGTPPED